MILVLNTSRFAGAGSYELPRLGALRCDFVQGRPLGPATLTDLDGQVWQGTALSGTLTLIPRNHLFDSEDALCRAATREQTESVHSQKRGSGSQLETRNPEDHVIREKNSNL